MCTALKRKFPKLHVYCALDPYRQSIQAELRYAQEKINAGADGLFTQPFFDEKLAKIYCEQLAHTTLFVGIAPVLSIQSYQYWVDVNKVVFPACFNNSLEYNCTLAKNIIALATKEGQHSYIMPIKTDIMAYLSGIFTT
jgi:methylenetetrahydrofolate reductase (NADPH)